MVSDVDIETVISPLAAQLKKFGIQATLVMPVRQGESNDLSALWFDAAERANGPSMRSPPCARSPITCPSR